MHREQRALWLTVFIGETDSYHHRPLYNEIVRRALKAGWLARASFTASTGSAPPIDPMPTARFT